MKHLISTDSWEVTAYRWQDDDKPFPVLILALVRGYGRGFELGILGFHLFVVHVR